MELDSFLASPRWDIIKIITESPASPMEISEKIGTTISFVSQQLKLLEAIGIIKKQRTGSVEKGKPRTLFSLSKESVYLIPLAKGISEKKLLDLSPENKAIISILSLENGNLHHLLQRIFWAAYPDIKNIDAIYIEDFGSKNKLYFFSKEGISTQKLNEIKKIAGSEILIETIASVNSFKNTDSRSPTPIYDPRDIFNEENNLKGGNI